MRFWQWRQSEVMSQGVRTLQKAAASGALLAGFFLVGHVAEAKLRVVTTTTDLEAIANAVGGSEVEVFAVGKGTQDTHRIEAKPSFIIRFRDADLVIAQGLDLESAWLRPLAQNSRNNKIQPGTRGFYELGPELEPIEVKTGAITRAEGDVHPGGNPHFQLDPIRLAKAAGLVAARFSELDPARKASYEANARALSARLEEKTKDWKARIEKSRVGEVVTYHKTFSYFLDRFGIKGGLQLEPKPGIPPTASHLLKVIEEMKTRGIRLVLVENFFDSSVGAKLTQNVPGSKIEVVPVSVGGEPGIKTNEDLIERLVKAVEGAAK